MFCDQFLENVLEKFWITFLKILSKSDIFDKFSENLIWNVKLPKKIPCWGLEPTTFGIEVQCTNHLAIMDPNATLNISSSIYHCLHEVLGHDPTLCVYRSSEWPIAGKFQHCFLHSGILEHF